MCIYISAGQLITEWSGVQNWLLLLLLQTNNIKGLPTAVNGHEEPNLNILYTATIGNIRNL